MSDVLTDSTKSQTEKFTAASDEISQIKKRLEALEKKVGGKEK